MLVIMTQAFQPCLRLKESPWIRRNRLSGLQVLLQLIFRPQPSVGNRQHVPLETAKKLSWKHQLRGLRSFGRRHEPGSLKTLHLISAAVRNLVIQRCVQQQEMQKKNEFQVKEETKALLENQHHIPGVFRKDPSQFGLLFSTIWARSPCCRKTKRHTWFESVGCCETLHVHAQMFKESLPIPGSIQDLHLHLGCHFWLDMVRHVVGKLQWSFPKVPALFKIVATLEKR